MRETEILVEQQPPQEVFVCDDAGLVINNLSVYRSCNLTTLDVDNHLTICAHFCRSCLRGRRRKMPSRWTRTKTTQVPGSRIPSTESRNTKFEARIPNTQYPSQYPIPNPESRNTKFEARIPDPGSRIPNTGSRNPNTGSRIPNTQYPIPNTEYRIISSPLDASFSAPECPWLVHRGGRGRARTRARPRPLV